MRICERPNLESERSSIMPCRPAIWLSSGSVTSFSISSGASAGTAVLTSTCGLVMSGTASIGSRSADHTPTTMSTSVASSTIARWRSDASTVLKTMRLFPFRRHDTARLPAFDRRQFRHPEGHHGLQDHLVAGVEAVLDFHQFAAYRAHLDRRANQMVAAHRVNRM